MCTLVNFCLGFPPFVAHSWQRESQKASTYEGMFTEAAAERMVLRETLDQHKADARRMAQEVRTPFKRENQCK